MDKTTLRYEIENHYDLKISSFTRHPKFSNSEGRIYAPLDLVGEDAININFGGIYRKVPLVPHLDDLLYYLGN